MEDKKEIACRFAEWMSKAIESNFKSGGTWFVNGELKSTEFLFDKFLESKQEQRQHLVDLMKTDEEHGMYTEEKSKANWDSLEGKGLDTKLTHWDQDDKKQEPRTTAEYEEALAEKYLPELKRTEEQELEKRKINAEEDYIRTPISVLAYITRLEEIHDKIDLLEEDYQRRINTIDEMLGNPYHDSQSSSDARLKTKISCYKTFISELNKIKNK
jgi:hypothetical protein